jgi:ABC-2 type transport system ATP-binding protein
MEQIMLNNSTNSMVKLVGLKKSYGNHEAVKGISFEIPKGQVVGFLGPNGAGKSTTMRIITGFSQMSAGEAFVCGINVDQEPLLAQKRMGYLPENNPLYEEMMVYEYLNFIADISQINENRKAKICSAIERCGLSNVMGKDIGTLSKGYRQRVGLAQAILHDPELLILDEPTSGLDPNQIIEIRNLIKELGREKTVLMSTHILSEVQSTCSRVLIINNGLLVADDSPESLNAKEGGMLHLVLTAKNGTAIDKNYANQMLARISGITKVADSYANEKEASFELRYNLDPRKEIFEHIVKEGWIMLEMRKREVSLEEVFKKLTSNNIGGSW